MTIIRSERVAAALLLLSAALGLIAANSPVGPALLALQRSPLALPGSPFHLTAGHWISDGLLAIFFFVVAVELKHELTVGQLDTFGKALRPGIAALGGIIVPIALYLWITAGTGYARGWPVPTATDIAFALGILAVFGRGMPGRLRVFILALAILDDIVAIVIIAVFFTKDPDFLFLAAGAVGVVVFGLLSTRLHGRARIPVMAIMAIVAVGTWGCVYLSGVHATIAGVALGLAMSNKPAMRMRHSLEPVSNGVVLPLFAFSAALVALPEVSLGQLAPPFWGILVALPVGKILGITLGAWVSTFFGPRDRKPHLTRSGLLTAGALGGIGFTVSLLMNQLAFGDSEKIAGEGTLAVLLGSAVSIVLSAVLVSRQAAYYARLRALRREAEIRSPRRDTPHA